MNMYASKNFFSLLRRRQSSQLKKDVNKPFSLRVKRHLDRSHIRINGNNPWDIQVHNEGVYHRVLAEGSLGLGESYMDGWWDCHRLDEFFNRILRAGLDRTFQSWRMIVDHLKARLFNFQKISRAYYVGKQHYDIGNDLYRCMLDELMIYSCAYWSNADSLDDAQKAKLDLVCRKLHLKPGMKVLDIGCGWGGTARFAAERYGVDVTGVTVSEEQARFGRKMCRGLPVHLKLQDYRSLNGKFDRILSIGMFEHVGYKNYRMFMEKARKLLKSDGLFALQTIGANRSVVRIDPWINRYIFPNAMLPSATQLASAVEGLFVIEDWQNFGPHYEKTLLEWHKNFQENWNDFKHMYDDRFYRMWNYYLLSCAGTFRARKNQLWQIVLSPEGVRGGYRPKR
jgi:cyclopropane-fatty-acyl-phospholipid synthase